MYQQIRRAIMASLLTMFCFVAFAQKTVTGTVKDANGEPMIGVSPFPTLLHLMFSKSLT